MWIGCFAKSIYHNYLDRISLTLSKNNYQTPAIELVSEKEAVHGCKIRLDMSPKTNIIILKTYMVHGRRTFGFTSVFWIEEYMQNFLPFPFSKSSVKMDLQAPETKF